jgi:hypothetical protein
MTTHLRLPFLASVFASLALLMSSPTPVFADVFFPFLNVGAATIGRVSLLSPFFPSTPFSRRDTSSGGATNSGGNTDTTQGQNAPESAVNNPSTNNSNGNNGGATSGSGGNGGRALDGGTVHSGDTTSNASAFNSMNTTTVIIRLSR